MPDSDIFGSFVLLDGITFLAEVLPVRSYITPFIARLGAGEPRFSDLEPASHWVKSSFGGGFGKHDEDIFEDTARFWDSTAWTHLPGSSGPAGIARGAVMLPGKRVTFASGAINVRPQVRQQFRGTWYIGGDPEASTRGLWTLATTPVYNEVTTAGAPPDGEEIFSLAIQTRYLYTASGTEGNMRKYDGTTWSTLDNKAHKIVPYLDSWIVWALWDSTTNEITLKKSDDNGATNTTLLTIYSATAPQSMVTCPDQRGNEMVIVGTQEKLWQVDVEAAVATVLYDFAGQVGEVNSRDMIAGCIITPVEPSGLLELTEDRGEIDMGYDRDDGLPPARMAPINTMWQTTHWLFAGMGTNFYSGSTRVGSTIPLMLVMNRQTRTWHYIAQASGVDKDLAAVFFTGAVDSKTRLYFFETDYNTTACTPYYVEMPEETDNPAYSSTDIAAETSGYVVTGRFNGGFFNLPGAFLSMLSQHRNIAASRTIKIAYALNDAAYVPGADTNFTTAVTYNTAGVRSKLKLFTSGSVPSEKLGIQFDNVRLKITLVDTSGSGEVVGAGPILMHLVTDFIQLPARLNAWRVRIYNTPDGLASGTSNESFFKKVTHIAHDPTLISFYPSGSDFGDSTAERYFVRISSLIEQGFADGGPDGRTAFYDVVLSEIVMSQDLSAGGIYPVAS